MASAAENVIEVLDKATHETLADIDQRIADTQSEIEKLKAVRRVIDIKVNGKKARKAPVRKVRDATVAPNASETTMQRRRALAIMLGKHGPMDRELIAEKLAVQPGAALAAVLNCDWFKLDTTGWRLTEIGRKEALVKVA